MNKHLRIIGSIVDIEKVTDMTKIKASENEGADFLYLKGRIMTCDEPNANGDYFPADEVKASYESFIGGIVDFNHDPNILLGKIIDATYMEEKDGNDWVEIICKINKKAYPEHTSNIEAGILSQMSLEAYADEAECSICGHIFDFIERHPCDHINGGLMRKLTCDDGVERTVYKIDKKLTFTGAGVVPNPADKNADIEKVIAQAKEKVKDGKIAEAKETIETLVDDEEVLKGALKKLDGLEFIAVLEAVKNKENGTTKNIASKMAEETEEIMTEKEFYDMLSAKYNKLTTIEIDDIKAELKKSNKLLSGEYNAHLITSEDEEPYWMIVKNELPQFKAPLSNIWGEDLKKDIKVDGQPLVEYGKSDAFRKRLLLAIQKEGIEYVKKVWSIEEVEEESEVDLLDEIKMVAKELMGMDVLSGEVITELFKGMEIEASQTHYVKDKFCECIADNLQNDEIEAKNGQSQQDAVESFCFNKVLTAGGMRGQIVASKKKDFNVWDVLWRISGADFKDCKQNYNEKACAWLEYKVKGKWHKDTGKKILTKAFVLENKKKLNKFDRFNDTKDYMVNLGFSKEFADKYGVLASKRDIDSLLNTGFNKESIEELFKLRFLGE